MMPSIRNFVFFWAETFFSLDWAEKNLNHGLVPESARDLREPKVLTVCHSHLLEVLYFLGTRYGLRNFFGPGWVGLWLKHIC